MTRKLCFFIFAILLCSCTTGSRFRLIHDDDGSSSWHFPDLTVGKIEAAVDLLAGTGVTSYAICAGEDYANFNSRFGKSPYIEECALEKNGIDFIRTVLERARERGMEPILTYRMNDLHYTDTLEVPDEARKFMSKWWWDHPQFWIDEYFGWHTVGAYDFAHKEVRDRKVAFMTEQVDRYGDVIDVYLMDFLRFFCYFKQGQGRSHTAEMTDMVRRMRAVTDSVSKAKGHKILLAARVAPVNDNNLDQGLDVRQWLKEGLVDFLTLGIHCLLDGQTPVDRFRKDMGKDLDVPVYACGCDIMYNYADDEKISDGMVRGWCSNVLARGSDGLQSFNYYTGIRSLDEEGVPEGRIVNRRFHMDMYEELTSLDKLEGRNKIYWLSDGNREYGLTPNTPLPLEIAPGGEGEALIYVGDRMKTTRPEEVIFFFRTSADASMEVTLNGREILKEVPEYNALYDRNTCLKEGHRQWAVTFPTDAVRHGDNVVRFNNAEGEGPVKIIRTELALKYGPVETNGYF